MQNRAWCLSERVVFSQLEDRLVVLDLEKGTSHFFSLTLTAWFEALQQPKETEALVKSLGSDAAAAEKFVTGLATLGLITLVDLPASGTVPRLSELTSENLNHLSKAFEVPNPQNQLSGLSFGGALIVMSAFIGLGTC